MRENLIGLKQFYVSELEPMRLNPDYLNCSYSSLAEQRRITDSFILKQRLIHKSSDDKINYAKKIPAIAACHTRSIVRWTIRFEYQ